MKLFSLVLRLVLCACLVANGAGAAQASARMAFAHDVHRVAKPALARAAAGEPPCHAQATVARAAVGAAREASPVAHVGDSEKGRSPASGTDDPDCCKGNVCTCACMHFATCDVVQRTVAPPLVLIAPRPPALRVQHAQPRLPHLIRPPIG